MTDKPNNEVATGLYRKGKRAEVDRMVLSFQTIESVANNGTSI